MKVYIKNHESFAGHWIYNKGYASAWESKGYDVVLYNSLSEINDSDYYLMAIDGDVNLKNLNAIERAKKTFLYAQPNWFPQPWGSHPNFVSLCSDETIKEINSIDTCKLWSFADVKDYHNKWKQVDTILLAFDSINYKNIKIESPVYDVCFIGGWANNGFNEKKKIMLEHFSKLKESNLKCGIFINKNLTHEQENHVLCNSKVALNIHDAYQKTLGLDSNERTFKSLGLTGALVCDNIAQVKNEFDNVQFYNNSSEIIGCINNFLQMSNKELENIKEINKNFILNNHTYISRVDALRNL